MPTPRENAAAFAAIWNLERPSSVHVTTRNESELVRRVLKETEGILFPPDFEGKESRIYGGAAEDFERRRTSEYAGRVVERLHASLTEANVTPQFKQYLVNYLAGTAIPLGIPASQFYPIEDFGIVLEAEIYGMFDPNADSRHIEELFLSSCEAGESGRRKDRFIKEWREAYNQRYGILKQ